LPACFHSDARQLRGSTAMSPGCILACEEDSVFNAEWALFHMHMLDGVKGRDSGVIILRDGTLVGGGPYFWSIGTYAVGDGTWKGEFTTNQQEVTSGFLGTFTDDGAEAFGTSLVGTRSLGFRATLKRLADD
jgi:hypothetical protein